MARKVAAYVALISVVLCLSGCQSADEPVAAPQMEASDEPVTAETPVVAEVNAEPGFALALTFAEGQKATYRVVSETERSLKWEGNAAKKPASFHDGRTGHRIDMTFEQQVQEVDGEGNAVLVVTIKALRYLGLALQRVALDYDSSRPQDLDSPLTKLIGQSYTIKMTPKGEVAAIVDAATARQAAEGNLPANKTAAKLVSDGTIRERHEIAALMASKTTAVQPQEQWSDVKAFSFGMMGAKTYERLYTLDAVDENNGTATVQMTAIPATVAPGQVVQGQATNPFAGNFDNTESYTGRLNLDLGTGQIKEYVEELRIEWITADPAALAGGESDPAVLKMGVAESYHLERLN